MPNQISYPNMWPHDIFYQPLGNNQLSLEANKINELEQRITILENKVKMIEENEQTKQNNKYHTSMNMM